MRCWPKGGRPMPRCRPEPYLIDVIEAAGEIAA
jgi:hypothetical protein